MKSEELEVLFSANKYLLTLIPGFKRIAEDMRNRNMDNIINLTDGMEGVAWLTEAFTSIDECKGMNANIDAMAKNMEAINNALHAEDFTSLADILEQEIVTVLNEWLTELDGILRSGDFKN